MYMQLEQLDGDTLMISVTPADVGKPTSKLEKTKVREGSCYWEKPLYETVKFSQDAKTGKFLEKIYHFVVAKVNIALNLCLLYISPNEVNLFHGFLTFCRILQDLVALERFR